eukprot:1066216_1
MLKKFGSMGQSLRDVTKSYATKAAAKINELQTLPQEIPENWDERIDENGKPYYVDTVTGEWYRVRAKQHKRIDTNEKISILTAESKKEFDDQKDKMLDEDGSLSESYSDNDLPSDTPPDDTNATKGGVEIKGLTEEQRTQLSMFMGCSESTEVDASIKCLRDANWNPRRALETYFQQHPDPDHRLQQDNGNNEKPKIQQDESNHMVAKNDSSQSSVVPVVDVGDEKGQENQSIIESTKNGVNKQFYMFLQQHRLEQYFDKFKENECHDIRDLEYFDEDFIKNEIGIKSPIQRRRFIGECKKFKVQMDEFKQLNSIPPMLLMKLQTFGIVTMYILCQEVQQELDLKNKFGLGDTQCQLLWNIINDHSQPKSNKMDQAEGITDNVFNHVMDTAR